MGEVEQSYTPPAAFQPSHDAGGFDCGNAVLNDWLKQRAAKSEGRSARTFVVCAQNRVAGYYCLAAGAVQRETLPNPARRNLPASVPVVILGRLAVDKAHQGRGVARGLLKDCFRRTLLAAREIGVRAILVHAIDDEVVPFYRTYDFVPLPMETRSLFLPLETIAKGL